MPTPTDDLVQAAVAHLQAALPALVAAEGLPAITEFLNHDPGLPQVTKAPQVWVDLPGDENSTDPKRGATVHKRGRAYNLMIGVTSAGADADAAVRRLRKCVDLIIQAMETDETLGGTALWALYRGTDYSPNIGGNQVSLFKEAILTFDLNRQRRLGAS